jgi:hypothetical protein
VRLRRLQADWPWPLIGAALTIGTATVAGIAFWILVGGFR